MTWLIKHVPAFWRVFVACLHVCMSEEVLLDIDMLVSDILFVSVCTCAIYKRLCTCVSVCVYSSVCNVASRTYISACILSITLMFVSLFVFRCICMWVCLHVSIRGALTKFPIRGKNKSLTKILFLTAFCLFRFYLCSSQ